MKFIPHPSNNLVLGAPKDWDQEAIPCGALPVTRTPNAFTSYWQPNAEELKAMNAGQPVLLIVFGEIHPPVAIEVRA